MKKEVIIAILAVLVIAVVGIIKIAGRGSVITSTPLAADAVTAPVSGQAGGVYCLSRTILSITIENNDANVPQLSIEKIQLPDTQRYFRIDYDTSIFATDDIKVDTNGGCLITAVDAKVTDQTGDALRQLANLGIQLSTGLPNPAIPLGGANPNHADTKAKFVGTLDIGGPEKGAHSLAQFNAELAAFFDLKLSVKPYGAAPVPHAEASNIGPGEGIYYRVPVPYILSFTSTKGGALVKAASVTVENGGPIALIGVARGAFVERHTTLAFTNGVLTSAHITKPSELLGLLAIPVDIVKGILGISAAQRAADTASASSEADSAVARARLYEDKLKEENAQAELDRAHDGSGRQSESPPPPAPQTNPPPPDHDKPPTPPPPQ